VGPKGAHQPSQTRIERLWVSQSCLDGWIVRVDTTSERHSHPVFKGQSRLLHTRLKSGWWARLCTCAIRQSSGIPRSRGRPRSSVVVRT
jgi:hypothetical protein